MFNAWFLARELSKFAPDVNPAFVASVRAEFPELEQLPPERQKRRLLRAVQKWKAHRGLRANVLTERHPLILP